MKRNILLAVAALSVGCASATIKTNPDSKFPLDVTDAKPAFLFPVNLSHLGSGGDTTAMGITVTAGVASKYGKQVVSGQQLFDMVGNLSFDLAENIKAQVDKGEWKMTGSAKQVSDDLAGKMEAILGTLAEKGLIEKGFKFKYIIAVHSHGEAGMGGATLAVNSWGGIYDIETGDIVSYIESKDSYANKPEAVMAQLPSAYNGIIEKLISGKAN
jgi:hypothetical protein